LQGVGAERLVSLRISGAGVADAAVLVVNRTGFDPKPYNAAARDNNPKRPYMYSPPLQGPEVSIVAEPEKIVRGVARDAGTGKARPNIDVLLTQAGDHLQPALSAKTDSEGRYEIPGARKTESYKVEVQSDPAAGYLGCQVVVPDTPGYHAVIADIGIPK